MPDTAAVRARIKTLIVESLHLQGTAPSDIGDEAPLFGEGLGLDSVDALELMVALEKEYGLRIEGHQVGKETFTSVSTLAAFVQERLAARPS
jgi:acyl carrier protein